MLAKGRSVWPRPSSLPLFTKWLEGALRWSWPLWTGAMGTGHETVGPNFEKFRRSSSARNHFHFLLAAAVHIVELVSSVFVLAWTTVEFVPLSPPDSSVVGV